MCQCVPQSSTTLMILDITGTSLASLECQRLVLLINMFTTTTALSLEEQLPSLVMLEDTYQLEVAQVIILLLVLSILMEITLGVQ